MASANEIAARVERADAEKTRQRSTAAVRVAELAEQRDALTRDLGGAVGEALKVMDAGELATFTGRAPADLKSWAAAARPGGRRSARATARPDKAAASAGAGEPALPPGGGRPGSTVQPVTAGAAVSS